MSRSSNAFLPLLELFDPKVHLLKVNTPRAFERSEDSHKAIDRFLQRHELKKFTATIYNDLSIEEGILNFAKGIDADLIAMATHGRTGLLPSGERQPDRGYREPHELPRAQREAVVHSSQLPIFTQS